uniref:Uncharacterized protein n=1 Tax=viral metagenome TaxID=1070528 RepID=A0A6C0KXN0_9ZZZZ|tara:strand:+ start:13764 stop:14111 length:348 start_codon:yes stop_codon:yes gene_type:complete
MLTSDKLLKQKSEKEINSRIDDNRLELIKVKTEMKVLIDDIKSFKESFNNFQIEINNKFKEIFAYTRRLDEAYLNGLSDYDMQDGIYKPEKNGFDSKLSSENIFSIENDSIYDKL